MISDTETATGLLKRHEKEYLKGKKEKEIMVLISNGAMRKYWVNDSQVKYYDHYPGELFSDHLIDPQVDSGVVKWR